MTSVALKEAVGWLEEIMTHYFKGRGDREFMIRGRVADDTGIPESYLYRLQYKTRGMKDVAGEAYRRLKLSRDRIREKYSDICEKNEAAAARYRAERLSMDGKHEAVVEEPDASSVGTVSAVVAAGTPSSDCAEEVMN